METDERFKNLVSDPRFKTLKKKQRKVVIDDRFKSMFTNPEFNLKYSRDKRGNVNKKTSSNDLRKYYSLDEKESRNKLKCKDRKKQKEEDVVEEEEGDDEENEHQEDEVDDEEDEIEKEKEFVEDEDEEQKGEEEEDNIDEDVKSSSEESSSSSDESESEAEEEPELQVQYDWKPMDHDAETAENTTRRLALQNFDWDHLDVKDIFTLVHSVRPPKSVKVYVSQFGKERLKDEELHGPKEIVEMPKVDEDEEEYNMLKKKIETLKKSKQPKGYTVNNYEDADEEMDPRNEEIRERIRAYQLNRMKYYYAVIEFDSAESAEAAYKELDGLEYEGSSLELDLRFIPDDVEFDDEDLKAECDKVPDLTSYEAPQFINTAIQQTTVKFTWDETDVKRQANLHKAYTKQELEKGDLEAYLGSETESEDENEDVDDEARNKYKLLLESLGEEEEKKKKVEVDVEWSDDDGKESRIKFQRTKDDSDSESDENQEEFEFDPDDERFKAIYESGLYNVDPSKPNFKRTKAFDRIAERKRAKKGKPSLL